MLTVITSGKAAPGVTTSVWALALAWPRPILAADCDPAGGDMAGGLLAGRLIVDRGLLAWSSATRRGAPALASASALAQYSARLPEHESVWFLPGFTTAAQGFSFTEETWERLSLALQRVPAVHDRDVIVDAGRLVGERGNWPLFKAADQILIAVRPSVRSVHAAQDAMVRLRYELGDLAKVSALVIDDGPYTSAEVVRALEIRLGGRLPHDPGAAAVLSDGATAGSKLSRTALMRAAAKLGNQLASVRGAVRQSEEVFG